VFNGSRFWVQRLKVILDGTKVVQAVGYRLLVKD
jgi:hypothetical protein